MEEERKIDPSYLDELSEIFDENQFIEEEILPRWKEIFDLCLQRGIPVLFSIAKSRDAEKAEASTGMLIPSKRTPLKMQIVGHFLAENPNEELQGATKAAILAALGGASGPGGERENGCNCPVCRAERKPSEDKPN